MAIGKKPVIEIIAVGSELMSWIKAESNSRFITRRLEQAGLTVHYRTVVGDDPKRMETAFRDALARSQIIFVSGGLGPTLDDITGDVLGNLLGKKIGLHESSLEVIKRRYKKRGLSWTPSAARQARMIQGAEVLKNDVGHAPGMMIPYKRKILILLPGVPAELKRMYDRQVHDKLVGKLKPSPPGMRILKLTGLPEARANDIVSPFIPSNAGIKVLFTVGQGELMIRMQAEKSDPKAGRAMLKAYREVKKALGEHVFSSRNESLENTVARLLRKRKLTVATAESCTGGLLAHRLTGVAGSSDYFQEGMITYTNEAKVSRLGVDPSILNKKGAVSPEVAEAMAEGIKNRAGTSLGIGITGIAGPGGGTKEKPVGLVYIALADSKGVSARRYDLPGDRSEIKFRTTQAALDLIRLYIRKGSLNG